MPPLLSRRQTLDHLGKEQAQHPGLWLDKFIRSQIRRNDNETAEQRDLVGLMREVVGLSIPDTYKPFFQRWRRALDAMHEQRKADNLSILQAWATTNDRLAVGLGAESVLETHITLHRTYGVPYIPGSALKGLAAAYARKRLKAEWRPEGEAYRTLFGDTTKRGYITFYDALYDPDSTNSGSPLVIDVLTVHHPDYYGDGSAAPADWDNPNPVAFISATGRFLVALDGPTAWVDRAYKILKLALAEDGVGAKTSSGYGRMTLLNADESVKSTENLPTTTPQGDPPRVSYDIRKRELLREDAPSGRARGTVVDVRGKYASINPGKGGGKPVSISQEEVDVKLRNGLIVEYATVPGQRAKQVAAAQVKVLLQPDA